MNYKTYMEMKKKEKLEQILKSEQVRLHIFANVMLLVFEKE